MKNEIIKAFKNKKAFIAYLMAGDPTLNKTKDYIKAMEKAGADLIEIGIPFSDPIAEGEVIQRANIRALKNDVRLNNIFQMVSELDVNIPLVFMTYLNPVFIYGYDAFFKKCKEVGINGIIIPDLPFEEQKEVSNISEKYNISVITLVAPTSKERIENIAKNAKGFIYLVSSMGVTGMRKTITTDLTGIVSEIKKYSKTPVAIGFGISTPEQAKNYSKIADGVIVGSAIVNIIGKHGDKADEVLSEYVKSMKGGM